MAPCNNFMCPNFLFWFVNSNMWVVHPSVIAPLDIGQIWENWPISRDPPFTTLSPTVYKIDEKCFWWAATYIVILWKLPIIHGCYHPWMESLYVPLSKSDEKLRAHKIITGGPPAPVLSCFMDDLWNRACSLGKGWARPLVASAGRPSPWAGSSPLLWVQVLQKWWRFLLYFQLCMRSSIEPIMRRSDIINY